MDLYTASVVPDGGHAISQQAHIREVFTDLGTVSAARAARSRLFSVPLIMLLADLDPAAAAPLFYDIMRARFQFWAVSYEGWVVMLAGAAWWKLTPLLPEGALADLWLTGAAKMDGLRDEQLARVPPERVAEATAARRISPSDVEVARYFKVCPTLTETPARLTYLRTLEAGTPNNYSSLGSLRHLIPLLERTAPDEALPIILDLYERHTSLSAKEALFRLRHPATMQRLASQLDEAISRAPLKWDPFHVSPGLADPLRAMFALEPSDSSTRFARYFTDEALATEHGAKLARDALALGNSVLVNHGGTVLKTGDVSWLSYDPGWMLVLERLATHVMLGPLACELLPKGNKARKAGLAAAKLRAKERTRVRKEAKAAKAKASEDRKAAAAAKKEAAALKKEKKEKKA